MKNNIVKLNSLEEGVIYKDEKGQFFKVFREEYAESPRSWDNVFTFLTWERGYKSPDENDMTLREFAEAHGVDTQKEWGLSTIIHKMEDDGYSAWPIYGLYHGGAHYSLCDFNDRWDSGCVGIAYVNKRDNPYIKDLNDDELKHIAQREMEEYDAWVQGDVWGITLLSSHNEWLDSSSGYIATKDWVGVLEDMMSAVGVVIQDEYEVAKVTTVTTLE